MNPTTLCCFLLAVIVTLTITIVPTVHANAEADADAIWGKCPKIRGMFINF